VKKINLHRLSFVGYLLRILRMCILLNLTAMIYGFRIIIRLLMVMNLLDAASPGIL